MADFQKWQDEGNDALTAKDYEKALSCFQKALESNPELLLHYTVWVLRMKS